MFFFGAEDEVRTRDLQLGKLPLYQLSYFRVLRIEMGFKYTENSVKVILLS